MLTFYIVFVGVMLASLTLVQCKGKKKGTTTSPPPPIPPAPVKSAKAPLPKPSDISNKEKEEKEKGEAKREDQKKDEKSGTGKKDGNEEKKEAEEKKDSKKAASAKDKEKNEGESENEKEKKDDKKESKNDEKFMSSIEISPTNCQSIKAPRMLLPPENDEVTEAVLSWMMPLNFSQSQLGDRRTPSNACTLIAIHFADLCHRFNIQIPYRDKEENWVLVHSQKESLPNDEICERNNSLYLPEDLLRMFTNGILNGNITHESAIKKRERERVAAAEASKGTEKAKSKKKTSKKSKTTKKDEKEENRDILKIPEAIREIRRRYRSQIHEIHYVRVKAPFELHFPGVIGDAIKSRPLARMNRLYFIVIAVKRAVFIAFQRDTNTVALFDSHSHRKQSDRGGAIACVSANQLSELARWMMKMIYPELLEKPEKKFFEVSCVQVLGPRKKNDAPNVVYWQEVTRRIWKRHSYQPRNDRLKQKERRLNERKKRTFKETLRRTGSGSSDEDTDWEVYADGIYDLFTMDMQIS